MSGHPLVAIGDSLTQGFMSGAICRTDLAYPVMLAHALGVDEQFHVADFRGGGGFPINLELLLQQLSDLTHGRMGLSQWPRALLFARNWMDRCEDYWERGPGAQPASVDRLPDNLAIWAVELCDALTLTAGYCEERIRPPHDNLLAQVPEEPWHRTARRVLNPTFSPAQGLRTQLSAAQELALDGGIERLLVWLGASNALGAVCHMKIEESTGETYRLLPHQRLGNLLRAEHFRELYTDIARQAAALGAKHVFLVNVPHVTIGPSSRGVSPGGTMLTRPGSARKYFEYYGRPWIWDEDFAPDIEQHLTGEDAMRLDARVDEYNACIAEVAAQYHWHVVDVCSFMDGLAYRSNAGQPTSVWPAGLVQALRDHPDLSYLVVTDADGHERPKLDTRFFWATPDPPHRVAKGGLFSLDGIHPTVIGYSLLADLMLQKMKDVGAAPPTAELDWHSIVREDALVGQPPAVLGDLREVLTNLRRAKLLDLVFDAITR